MLMQWDGSKILLLPAWPMEWDVDCRLQAPDMTTIDLVVKDGEIVKLEVFPEERRKDVVIRGNRRLNL